MNETPTGTATEIIDVHRFEAQVIPVNAYVVTRGEGAVVVDAALAVSDAKALRAHVDDRGLRLLAVLVTHAHPDHYAGLTDLVAGADVPILATEGVNRVIRRDDPFKNEILGPMFGEEWPRERTFPSQTVADGETVEFGGMRFRVMDLGPGESPHDSIWILEDGRPRAFVGDVVYNHMHCYLADGHHQEWLANIERVRSEFSRDTTFYVGHGDPASPPLLDWQVGYIETFVRAVEATLDSDDEAATEAVTNVMRQYLPDEDLLFLMQLSVSPVRAVLSQ